MQTFDSLERAALRGVYLAIGSFDGLHRGHRHLLEKMTQAAQEDGAPAVALTFFPHPRVVLGQASRLEARRDDGPPFRYLIPLEERLRLLGEFPLDAVIVQPFTPEFSRTAAADFLSLLKTRLGLRSLWCGPNFSLGKGREGNVAYLTEKSVGMGFSLYVVPPLTDSTGPIASSRIRQALAAGDVIGAAELLGRQFALSGTVVHGMGRGRTLGFPTANLDFWPELAVPAHGIYAGWVYLAGRRFAGATSIGVRPTFDNGTAHAATVETHLLDFDGDIYGANLQFEFVARLRPEIRFPDTAALRQQMMKDVAQTRLILQEEP
ncbi:MAG: riboflavin biosynthesis protein RibF [Chloroflexi bacterium RBG_13_60_9]|nr:MAG: riboflavin biosynthesis protein RibF [Chloroflexi bacterium RBG_13_60_9]